MLIYNITLKIDWAIQPQWLAWMKQVYIKKIMESGCFVKQQLVRLLEVNDEEGPTYALQLYAGHKEDFDNYAEYFLVENEAFGYEKWKNGVLSFSTLMQIEDQG